MLRLSALLLLLLVVVLQLAVAQLLTEQSR
jgi:hypothetical protein